MKAKLIQLAALLGGFCTASAAETPALANTCLGCHQPAVSAITGAPVLAGQQAFYLSKQLQQFQNGQRGSHATDVQGRQMAVLAATLSHDEITQLAGYFSRQAVDLEPQTAAAALLDQGRRIYIGSCGACHGAKAEGNPAFSAPALPMLSAGYISLQLAHFKHGVRGTAQTDKPGRQMALISRSLSEQDMQAVAAYIGAGLP